MRLEYFETRRDPARRASAEDAWDAFGGLGLQQRVQPAALQWSTEFGVQASTIAGLAVAATAELSDHVRAVCEKVELDPTFLLGYLTGQAAVFDEVARASIYMTYRKIAEGGVSKAG
jgi:hypothetical protein